MGNATSRVYQASNKKPSDKVRVGWPRSVTLYDRFTKISPVWEEDFRLGIEASMAKIPLVHETWFRLRIEHRAGAIRLFKDGLLVAERRPPGRIRGDVGIQISNGTRLASLTIRRPGEWPTRFYSFSMDGICNAKGIGGKDGQSIEEDSVPRPDVPVSVRGVPFVFPDRSKGSDHLDVGASLFHYRHEEGHFMALKTWPAPNILDPARIRISVPNRSYSRLWIIAASDGDPFSVPVVTVRFYRPSAGFAVDAQASVPTTSARSGQRGARRLGVTLVNGKKASLWLVPIVLDSVAIGSLFREALTMSVELTKGVYDYRASPDPAVYGTFPGGLPSGVHIYGMTFEEAPLRLIATGNRAGNVYISPEEPVWQVDLENLWDRDLRIKSSVSITGPHGKQTVLSRDLVLAPRVKTQVTFPISTSVFGLHQVRTEIHVRTTGIVGDGPRQFSQEGTFVQMPPDTRRATATNSRWGLWQWSGGHHTNPNVDENLYLLRAAGTRIAGGHDYQVRRKWGMSGRIHITVRGPEKWAYEDPYDPKEYEAYAKKIGESTAEILKIDPDTQYFALFAENAISTRMTYGILPSYIGEPEIKPNEKEAARIRASALTAKAASEGIRKHAPKAKISFGWCEPTFSVPFMRQKYPKGLMDAMGVDIPQFERMPEMPIRSVAPNRMWILQQERKKHGYDDIPIIHTESYFPSSHRLALGHRGSANSYVRTAVLSLALGSTRLLYCFTLHDCGGYWGSQHYGCIGIVGRRPEYNPKPAFPAYATMTRLLDVVTFDGYVPTGSLTSYCVRFKSGRTFVYCLWTVRGEREAIITSSKAKALVMIDENSNETVLNPVNGTATVTLSPTPIWVTSDAPIENVRVNKPRHMERPIGETVLLDSMDESWTYDAGEYQKYSKNHWDLPRFPGPMKLEVLPSAERNSKVWQVTLDEPEKERKLAAWYGVFQPETPIEIPGKARALGVWANGQSNWGRIIYEVEDARGEVWQSIGTKEQWNCDDIHSWSYFNFDGWRYLEFPLPNHLPGDQYREKDTVWWNHDQDGIVDLPVKLRRIIIEHRTHHIYVTDCLAIPDRSVQLDDLVAVYDDPLMMTDAPVRLQREARNALKIQPTEGRALPNPIATLRGTGKGAPTSIVKVEPPDQYYDGTRLEVTLKGVEGATEYRVYVAAYETGSGAQQMAKSAETKLTVTRLRPEFPLYLFITYVDKDEKESKPSAPRRILLKDDFPMK
jgi:hypothetical protein